MEKHIINKVGELYDRVRSLRRAIHATPELSFAEHYTQQLICSELDREGISYRKIAGTGVLAIIEGRGDLKNAIVLRADMDALPVREATGLPFSSGNDGVMHACGHDMHTAALIGALLLLNSERDRINGTVFGLFQPGEEVWPGGATLVLKENPFDGYNIRAFVGEHVDPELPTGTFGFRSGKYMASTDELHITVTGEGGHAAMPYRLKDPVVASAAIIMALQQLVSRNANPAVPTVLSIGRVTADGATNVIPDTVTMEGTFRTFDESWRAEAKQRLRAIVESTATAYGVTAATKISDGYPCVYNDEDITARSVDIIGRTFGQEHIRMLDVRTTAEDFGYYTTLYPSVFYRAGVGGTACDGSAGKLHNAMFNPDEDSLKYAVAGLAVLALFL
ncbi:MAG: M20 family metallopeptidase [Rikenellaceae bacterium]|nr:M20 family metallopeptidase [Rikenellaceae bacterium]